MWFRKTLVQRLLNITKVSSQTLTNCCISSSSVIGRVTPRAAEPDDPGDNGRFRSPQLPGNLFGKLREMDTARNRIRLEGLTPLTPPPVKERVTNVDTKMAHLEMIKSKLIETRKSCITFPEFIRICFENCSDHDQALVIAKMLEDSAAVIVLGDLVFLKPEEEIETMLFRKIHLRS